MHVNSKMGLRLYAFIYIRMYACIHNTYEYYSVCLHMFTIKCLVIVLFC